MSCPQYRHSHVCVTQLSRSEITELDELVYVDSKELAHLHTEIERLEARIRELEGQPVSVPSSPLSYHSQDAQTIERQYHYIEDLERVMIDMRQSGRIMERKIRGLEDQLDNIRIVDEERLRARDARISQLKEELANFYSDIGALQAHIRDGELADAVEGLRSNIMVLVEELDKHIYNLEAAVDLGIGDLEEYVISEMEKVINEMRRTCVREVQSVKMAVNRVGDLVQAAGRTGDGK
ncbi:hypothetical protein VP1G_00673 [Cytospora mali]|uniref:Uncharacterized protein n=1 Tax=Cytospora mali TaxID=578113 RepID=A0A194UP01_CYTMA|nr:hypothetical protein VP1G_00673 [Valsa mali var. pyri (nom. inval.)]